MTHHHPNDELDHAPDSDRDDDQEKLAPARGIMLGVLGGLALWAVTIAAIHRFL